MLMTGQITAAGSGWLQGGYVGRCQQLQPGTPGERLPGCGQSVLPLFVVHPGSFQRHFHLVNHRGGFRCSRVALWGAASSCSPADPVSGCLVVGNVLRACSLCILAAFSIGLVCQFTAAGSGWLQGGSVGRRRQLQPGTPGARVGNRYCLCLSCILAAFNIICIW
jgi:hypothetical protein